MKQLFFFFLLGLSAFSQENKTLHLQDSIPLNADVFLGVDTFNNLYYTKNNILYKQVKEIHYAYQNISFNTMTSVDFLNPSQVTVFYQNFNAIVQLDRTLSELKTFSFNTLADAPTIRYANSSSNHRLWTFNDNTLQLEVFNFKTNQNDAVTQPISVEIIKMRSNYNFCWLLTSTEILKYNNYGNLINRFDALNYDDFWEQGDAFVLQKENELFVLRKNSNKIEKMDTPKIKIKDVFVKAETVYIYNGQKVYTYNLKLN